jgi:hypothetical protein
VPNEAVDDRIGCFGTRLGCEDYAGVVDKCLTFELRRQIGECLPHMDFWDLNEALKTQQDLSINIRLVNQGLKVEIDFDCRMREINTKLLRLRTGSR